MRTLEMPAVFSTTLRNIEPGLAPITTLVTAPRPGVVATVPIASVRPMIAVVALSRAET